VACGVRLSLGGSIYNPADPMSKMFFNMLAGFTGQGPASLTEHTAHGKRPVELADTSPYQAMIDHVVACLAGHAGNRIDPASALAALELTLDIRRRLTQPAR
jgi:hypothetical protein